MRKQSLKKRLLYLLLIALGMLFFYFTIASQMPALKKRALLFMFLLLADFYLWYSIVKTYDYFSTKKKTKKRKIGEIIFSIIYWIPAALMFILFGILNIKGVTGLLGTSFYMWFGVATVIYMVKFPIFILAGCYDVIGNLVIGLSKEKKKVFVRVKRVRKWLMRGCFALFILFSGVMVFGLLYGASNLQVKEINLKSSHPVFRDHTLKIVQISDLHLVSCSISEIENMTKIVNDQNPDFVFVTGDLVTYSAEELVPFLPVLEKIKAKYGIFSVLGNHDYARYASFRDEDGQQKDIQKLILLQEELGWKVLLNENVKVPVYDNDSIVIAGIEYWSNSVHFFKVGDIDKTFKGVSGSDYVIFLAHDPQIWDHVLAKNYPADLTLSGHTHGMQMGINTEGMKWSPASIIYKEWAGLYTNEKNKEQHLYVNVGIGTAGMPVRVGIYPEITVFNIEGK